MTSESPIESGTAQSADDELDAIYVRRLLDLQDCLRLKDLPAALGSTAMTRLEDLGDGLTTVAFHSDDVSQDVLDTVMNFRLAQFLETGLMSASLARRRNLLREPVNGLENTIHAVSLDPEGRIFGYLALVGTATDGTRALDDPSRPRFPVEEAHCLELLSKFAHSDLTAANAWELKRFARAVQTPMGVMHDRVPWHLIVAIGRIIVSSPDIRILMGDSKPEGALKHLGLAGLDPEVFPDTRPSLSHDHLMWPSYEQASVARPFVTLVPDHFGSFIDLIALHLRDGDAQSWQRGLVVKLHALRRDVPTAHKAPLRTARRGETVSHA